MRVVLTDYEQVDLALEAGLLQAAGLALQPAEPQCQSPEDVIRAAEGAAALVVQYAPIPRAVFEALPALRIVSVPQIGVDSIDLQAARAHGVWVANAPTANITEVAAHTLAMALALIRQLPAYDRDVRAGVWDYNSVGPLRRPGDLTYGLLGLGRISRLVVERAAPIFGRLLAYDPFVADADWPAGVERVTDLTELFASADVLSIHVPLTNESRGLVGAELLAAMKPGSFLVNVARGPIVDTVALIAALDAGQLAGAALDVLPQEPPAADDPLLRHDKVLLSPHAAFYSVEAETELRRTSVENVVALLRDGRPHHVVVEGKS